MPPKILLYGADEHVGRLFVAEAVTVWAIGSVLASHILVLGGSDAGRLAGLAKKIGLEVRQFDLDQPVAIADALFDIDVVVNACTPIAGQAAALATGALQSACHVVDLNLDVDAFLQIENLDDLAQARQRSIVLGAGPGAGASSLMVDAAVRALVDTHALDRRCIGAMRIGLGHVAECSRSSAASAWHALSHEVTVVRAMRLPGSGGQPGEIEMRLDGVPVGQLERQFDFRVGDGLPPEKDLQLASAASLVDTVSARASLERRQKLAAAIESYVVLGTHGRLTYQAGSMLASLAAPFGSGALLRAASLAYYRSLPDGQAPFLASESQTIVLWIEDEERSTLVDWRLRTPGFYATGVRIGVAAAASVASGKAAIGVLLPADVLDTDLAAAAPVLGAGLRDAVLDKRILK